MSFVEPGSLTIGSVGADGAPARHGWMYINTHAEIGAQFDTCRERGLVPRIVIFDPNFLRMTLAYHAHQPLPAGSVLYLVFNDGPLLCALPATLPSLEVYLQLLEGTGLRWMVAGYCDIVASGLARAAIERGGHVRVGLEDYTGDHHPTNAQLVAEVVDLARSVGRPVADFSANGGHARDSPLIVLGGFIAEESLERGECFLRPFFGEEMPGVNRLAPDIARVLAPHLDRVVELADHALGTPQQLDGAGDATVLVAILGMVD
jgi:hypothetical protein